MADTTLRMTDEALVPQKFQLVLLFTCASVVVACASGTSGPEPLAADVVVRGGWLFDGVLDARRRNTGIVIRDGEFAEVDADLAARTFPEARVIELDDDATVLPGMFDLHAHYNLDLVDACHSLASQRGKIRR